MANNTLHLKRIVAPGPGGCIPIVGALLSVILGRLRQDEDEEEEADDRA